MECMVYLLTTGRKYPTKFGRLTNEKVGMIEHLRESVNRRYSHPFSICGHRNAPQAIAGHPVINRPPAHTAGAKLGHIKRLPSDGSSVTHSKHIGQVCGQPVAGAD